MKNKATNKGTCQVCGNLQKLPNGLLSIHGYTTRCGFFEGVCSGANKLPFEQDKSLIDGAINRAEISAEEIKKVQAGLRAPVDTTETMAWANVYFPYQNKWTPSSYQWCRVTVTAERVNYSDGSGSYTKFSRNLVAGESDMGAHNRSWTASGKTLAQVIQGMNSAKADSMNKTLAEIATYVKWQQARIKDWAPTPLKALK